MRGVNQQEWKKAKSNRRMGYGSKSAKRTERWRRQKERERGERDAETRKSLVNYFKLRSEPTAYLLYAVNLPR